MDITENDIDDFYEKETKPNYKDNIFATGKEKRLKVADLKFSAKHAEIVSQGNKNIFINDELTTYNKNLLWLA